MSQETCPFYFTVCTYGPWGGERVKDGVFTPAPGLAGVINFPINFPFIYRE
jgi:hypothetical protein